MHVDNLLMSSGISVMSFSSPGRRSHEQGHWCLELKKDPSGSFMLVLQTCTSQSWAIQHTLKNWGLPQTQRS